MEFTLVAGLVLVVVLAVVQLAFALWVRTVLTDAASEGARLAALHGGSEAAAQDRVVQLVTQTLGAGYSGAVDVSREFGALGVPGYDVVVVEITAPLPVLGLLGPGQSLTASGSAVVER